MIIPIFIKRNKVKNLKIICISGLIISQFSFAEDNDKHTVGANISTAGAFVYETNTNDSFTSGASFEHDMYYRYMINEYIGIDNGFIVGGGGLIQDALGDKENGEIRNRYYLGFRSALYGQYPIFSKLHIYSKVGAAFIQARHSINTNKIKLNSTGFYGALGIKYKFISGWAIAIEHKQITGGDFESYTFSIGGSYSF